VVRRRARRYVDPTFAIQEALRARVNRRGLPRAREHPLTTLERLPPTEVFQTPVAGFRGGSRVAPTLIDTRLGDLDVVDSEYTPEVIAFIARPRRAHMDCCPIVAVARRSEIPLGLPEGGAIRATHAAVRVGGRS